MHRRYQRRPAQANPGDTLPNLQGRQHPEPEDSGNDDGMYYDMGGNPFGSPATITTTRIVANTGTANSPVHSMPIMSSPGTVPTPATASQDEHGDPSSSVSVITLVAASPSPSSSSPPAVIPTMINNGNGGDANATQTPSPLSNTSDSQRGRLPPGATIGLVIAGIIIAASLIIFFVRRRYVRRRIRLRKEWASKRPLSLSQMLESKGGSKSFSFTSESAESIRYGLPLQSPAIVKTRSSPKEVVRTLSIPTPLAVPVPPRPEAASYASASQALNATPTSVVPPFSSRSHVPSPFNPNPTNNSTTPPQATTASIPDVYGPPATVLSASSKVSVILTFVPTLADELSITLGEELSMIAEFDDGWGMCSNAQGEQGMVPMECVSAIGATADESNSSSGSASSGKVDLQNQNVNNGQRGLGGRSRRVSSLDVIQGRRF
ncbi:hypothetical protein FA15DRAFT_663662 [Coprinopsis marcescibilis]|uniref:SH3 domain-containing protein n=1 Tax=Coprinopsis marcescibilis TaxID=230819 RepID=A0A5C3LCC8_COPMA|nr:hypothetical protein FA15DRAFT_663662 [Coprinopsis marcescibilis]